jgi:ATP synthase protein I
MSHPDKNRFPKKVSDREHRKLDTRRQDKRVWFGLGMFGMVGWSIAIPAVAGAFLGIWIDSKHLGRYSWTLMLFMAGLCLGCYNAWYWLQRERLEITGKNRKEKK